MSGEIQIRDLPRIDAYTAKRFSIQGEWLWFVKSNIPAPIYAFLSKPHSLQSALTIDPTAASEIILSD